MDGICKLESQKDELKKQFDKQVKEINEQIIRESARLVRAQYTMYYKLSFGERFSTLDGLTAYMRKKGMDLRIFTEVVDTSEADDTELYLAFHKMDQEVP
jgi:hypothetical protein